MTVAIVFPGQGAHRDGMAGAWLGHPAFATFDEVGRASGIADLARLADDSDACAATALAQPVVFAAGIVAWRALTDAGVEPAAVAGHSLGEVTAAVAAGSLSLQQGAALVAERGRAFAAGCARNPGTMAAVIGLERAAVEAAIAHIESVTIANDNAPGQVVVAGPLDHVAAAVEACRAAGGRVRMLDVEGAFHTSAMAPATVRVATTLSQFDIADPHVPLVRGATADVATTGAQVGQGLVDGVLASVRWREVQERLVHLGVDALVEAGAGVLRGLARRTIPDVTAFAVDRPEAVTLVADALAVGPWSACGCGTGSACGCRGASAGRAAERARPEEVAAR